MKSIQIIFFVALIWLITGCASQEPVPITYSEPGTPKWCMDAANLIGSPNLDDWRKQLLFEKMRNNGCMD